MTLNAAQVRAFLDRGPAVLAELTQVRGSSPREAGTFMLVGADNQLGTVGGGQLEYMVIDEGRRLLGTGSLASVLDIPLGPEIGQCCGGRVTVSLNQIDPSLAAKIVKRLESERTSHPHVFVFGSGHVGRALAAALAPLPLQTHVVDTRRTEPVGLPPGVEAVATALPEALVRDAPEGSAYVILTHDHALDFLIAAEALKRTDAPYVGMVGSITKRARFGSWYRAVGGVPAALPRLVLPIGAQGIGDKRPAVIAALAAAEIMVHIGRREAQLCTRPLEEREVAVDH